MRRGVALAGAVVLAICASAQPAFGLPGLTELMSVTPDGTAGNAPSGFAGVAISDDGRFVAFESRASDLDLVAGDTEESQDVFVRDRLTGSIERVSVNLSGRAANSDSALPAISGDGRFVAFTSDASDLVPGDRDQGGQVFVRDRLTDETSQISVDSAGVERKGASFTNRNAKDITPDGRFVSFTSSARLVPEDLNNSLDIYVRDRQAGTTTIASRGVGGVDGNGDSFSAPISADGRYVAFGSEASNLVPGDTNGVRDVFVRDRATGATTRVSVASDGTQGNQISFVGSISADGRYVSFFGGASTLVPGDTNGERDSFVHDRLTGTTTRVSVASDGSQANFGSNEAQLSADGRYVVFGSFSTNLDAGATDFRTHVYLHDRLTGVTTLESVDSAGALSDGFSFLPQLSADGTVVVFVSRATNLTENEDPKRQVGQSPKNSFFNSGWDVFVHELSPAGP
jgi:hypothetical protein